MEVFAVLSILVSIVCVLSVTAVYFMTWINKDVDNLVDKEVKLKKKKDVEEQDVYTPRYADKTSPLDEFIPDTTKQMRVKVAEEDQITPLDEK